MSDYPVTAEEFNEMLPAEIKMVPRTIEKPKSKKYSDSLELLDSISDYHFIDKAFYKSAYGYLLPKAISIGIKQFFIHRKKTKRIGSLFYTTYTIRENV